MKKILQDHRFLAGFLRLELDIVFDNKSIGLIGNPSQPLAVLEEQNISPLSSVLTPEPPPKWLIMFLQVAHHIVHCTEINPRRSVTLFSELFNFVPPEPSFFSLLVPAMMYYAPCCMRGTSRDYTRFLLASYCPCGENVLVRCPRQPAQRPPHAFSSASPPAASPRLCRPSLFSLPAPLTTPVSSPPLAPNQHQKSS